MKNIFRSIGSHLFVLLFSMVLILSVLASKAIGTVYDDFNGSEINSTLWDIYDLGGILSQSGGLLNADGPPNLTYANLGSRSIFRGDVEFVLDWRDFYSTATVFTENCPNISLQVHSEGNFIFIFRSLSQGGHGFFSKGVINGVWVGGFSAPALSQSGLLKISRVGSIITTSYNEGMGWVPLGTFPGAFTGDVIVQISVYTGDNGTFHVSSDWVTYEGQVVFPPLPDIKANGSDDPLFVNPGENVDVTISLDPGDMAGVWADWWGILLSPYGTFPLFGFQCPLFELPDTSLFSRSWPMGWYIFLFGLDDVPDGVFELDWYDYVVVVSQPAGTQLENIPNFDDIVKEKMGDLIGE